MVGRPYKKEVFPFIQWEASSSLIQGYTMSKGFFTSLWEADSAICNTSPHSQWNFMGRQRSSPSVQNWMGNARGTWPGSQSEAAGDIGLYCSAGSG